MASKALAQYSGTPGVAYTIQTSFDRPLCHWNTSAPAKLFKLFWIYCQQVATIVFRLLSAMDTSARTTMKDAAKRDTFAESHTSAISKFLNIYHALGFTRSLSVSLFVLLLGSGIRRTDPVDCANAAPVYWHLAYILPMASSSPCSVA